MRYTQVEFNPYIYTLSKLSRFGYEISVFKYTTGRYSEQPPEQPAHTSRLSLVGIRVVRRQQRSPGGKHHWIEAMVKVFKVGQTSRSRSQVKNYGTMWKFLSQGIHMCNMKAISLLVRKLWPRFKFFKSTSNFKVKVTRSKIMVPCERSCHKEYTCAIWKPYRFW